MLFTSRRHFKHWLRRGTRRAAPTDMSRAMIPLLTALFVGTLATSASAAAEGPRRVVLRGAQSLSGVRPTAPPRS